MRPPPFALAVAAGALVAPAAIAQILLVDDEHEPHVVVSWPTPSGAMVLIEGDRPYRGVNERTLLDCNIECFVTVGGTRFSRGVTHPSGATIRVGFAKADLALPFFDGIANGGSVTVELRNIHFTSAATPLPRTVLQEVGYGEDPSLCGLPGQPEALYNTYDPEETLRGQLGDDNARLGALSGEDPAAGSVRFEVAGDGAISMVATIPYALFRHVKDPWLRTAPGAFNEPNHFHIEFEALPPGIAEAEDADAGDSAEPAAAADADDTEDA